MKWTWTATYAGSDDSAPDAPDLSGANTNELEITSAMIGFKLKATATANASGYTGSASKETAAVVASYAVNIADNITGGTVQMSGTTGGVGATITLTVTPDTGYDLDELTVTNDTTSGTIQTTKGTDDKYTFTMPASAVSITGFRAFLVAEPWVSWYTILGLL